MQEIEKVLLKANPSITKDEKKVFFLLNEYLGDDLEERDATNKVLFFLKVLRLMNRVVVHNVRDLRKGCKNISSTRSNIKALEDCVKSAPI